MWELCLPNKSFRAFESVWLSSLQPESQSSYCEHRREFYQQAQKPFRKLCELFCTSVQASSCWDFVVLGSGQAVHSQTCPVHSLYLCVKASALGI